MLGIKCWRIDYDNSNKGWSGFEPGQQFFKTETEALEAIAERERDDQEEGVGSSITYKAVEVTI